jgi:hypothetical protein
LSSYLGSGEELEPILEPRIESILESRIEPRIESILEPIDVQFIKSAPPG